MQIRKANSGDISQIEELLYQVHKIHADVRPDLFRKGSKKYSSSELERILNAENTPVFVAVDNEVVMGYIFCVLQESCKEMLMNIKTLYIDDFCVSKKFRGREVGTELYNYAVDYAKTKECYHVTLNVWADNMSAVNFYKKCGMKIQKIGMEHIL